MFFLIVPLQAQTSSLHTKTTKRVAVLRHTSMSIFENSARSLSDLSILCLWTSAIASMKIPHMLPRQLQQLMCPRNPTTITQGRLKENRDYTPAIVLLPCQMRLKLATKLHLRLSNGTAALFAPRSSSFRKIFGVTRLVSTRKCLMVNNDFTVPMKDASTASPRGMDVLMDVPVKTTSIGICKLIFGNQNGEERTNDSGKFGDNLDRRMWM